MQDLQGARLVTVAYVNGSPQTQVTPQAAVLPVGCSCLVSQPSREGHGSISFAVLPSKLGDSCVSIPQA